MEQQRQQYLSLGQYPQQWNMNNRVQQNNHLIHRFNNNNNNNNVRQNNNNFNGYHNDNTMSHVLDHVLNDMDDILSDIPINNTSPSSNGADNPGINASPIYAAMNNAPSYNQNINIPQSTLPQTQYQQQNNHHNNNYRHQQFNRNMNRNINMNVNMNAMNNPSSRNKISHQLNQSQSMYQHYKVPQKPRANNNMQQPVVNPRPFVPTCDIDKLLMTDNQIAAPSTTTNSPISPRTDSSSGSSDHKTEQREREQLQLPLNAEIIRFELDPDKDQSKLQLKDHVFISKDCTYRLGQYIVKENWGKQCSLLYKYLDYIFRCQVFAKQIIEIQHFTNKKNGQFLVFHSGLQRRSDNQFLYVLLVPNSISKIQKWRVQFGNIRNSFLSKQELIKKLNESDINITNDEYLPKRTKFSSNIADLLYDDTYSIQVIII